MDYETKKTQYYIAASRRVQSKRMIMSQRDYTRIKSSICQDHLRFWNPTKSNGSLQTCTASLWETLGHTLDKLLMTGSISWSKKSPPTSGIGH